MLIARSTSNILPWQDYTYDLYTYTAADYETDRMWIFTGGESGKGLISNTFIPFEQLRIRINGTREQRLEAYTLDWLTFLAIDNTKGFFKSNLSQSARIDLEPLTPWRDPEQIFNGSYLGARNSAGDLEGGGKFLHHLLEPESRNTVPDLASHIFKEWCCEFAIAAAVKHLRLLTYISGCTRSSDCSQK